MPEVAHKLRFQCRYRNAYGWQCPPDVIEPVVLRDDGRGNARSRHLDGVLSF